MSKFVNIEIVWPKFCVLYPEKYTNLKKSTQPLVVAVVTYISYAYETLDLSHQLSSPEIERHSFDSCHR